MEIKLFTGPSSNSFCNSSVQGRQFVFRSGGDNNHKLECGLKSAGYPYVSYSSIQRCITICSTVYCQVLKLFEYWFGKLVFEA